MVKKEDSGSRKSLEVEANVQPSTLTHGFIAHTPGPWDVLVHEIDGARSIQIISKTGGVIALCKAAQGHKEANALLIAAAPELLAALRLAAEMIPDEADVVDIFPPEMREEEISRARIIRAAISTAIGA